MHREVMFYHVNPALRATGPDVVVSMSLVGFVGRCILISGVICVSSQFLLSCLPGFWLNIRMVFLSGTVMGMQLSRGLWDLLYFWKWRFTGENAWYSDVDTVHCIKYIIGMTALYAVGVFADEEITMWLVGRQAQVLQILLRYGGGSSMILHDRIAGIS